VNTPTKIITGSIPNCQVPVLVQTVSKVKVTVVEEYPRVTIGDDGVGFQLPESLGDLLHSGKLGLAGMQERVQLLGGSLKIKSEVGKGITVVVIVPV